MPLISFFGPYYFNRVLIVPKRPSYLSDLCDATFVKSTSNGWETIVANIAPAKNK
jgi:hypothetical protein